MALLHLGRQSLVAQRKKHVLMNQTRFCPLLRVDLYAIAYLALYPLSVNSHFLSPFPLPTPKS
jgi:hypothetical protein